MLDTEYKFDDPKFKKGDYNLECCTEDRWDNARRKILIVLETVDGLDLRAGRLLANRSKVVLGNVLNYSMEQAQKEDDSLPRKQIAFSAVNFNNSKFLGENSEVQANARAAFTKRLHRIIDDLQPNVVLMMGDNISRGMLPHIKNVQKKRGWVFDHQTAKGTEAKFVPSLDLYDTYGQRKSLAAQEDDEDDDEGDNEDKYKAANLLFYCTEHVINALLGRMRFDLSYVKVKPKYINTIAKFDAFYEKLIVSERIACDTETKNLSTNHNYISTMQFAVDDSFRGYVLPMRHVQTPWTEEELQYIEKKLRAYFYARPGKLPLKYIIFQNGKFDTRVIRACLGIPLIYHALWEIRAGEWCLDENRGALVDFDSPHGGLDQIFQVYGNDHYERAAFGKEDRSNADLTNLDNLDFLEYAAMDVVSIMHIHLMQKERAKRLSLGDKNFHKFFVRAVTKQKSNTVHVLSHMKQYGAQIDRKYLAKLKGKDSPMLELMAKTEKEIMKFPEVKKTNSMLLKEVSTQKSNQGLFGRETNIFSFRTAAHKIALFINTMGLKPLGYTKEKAPQIDKAFINHYRKDNPIVDGFGKWTKLRKLWSTYIKGWWEKIVEDLDASQDWRLRADYDFFGVVTGRLNSFKPNLQQVPTRGEESKYIKRAFKAPKGSLHVKFDYSAHEVRCWSYVSFDEILADLFRVGQKLRQKVRRTKSLETVKELLTRLKRDGDIHILNIKFFFDKWVEKSDPLRDAIKQVVFGTIYQKSAKSLAKDIGKPVEFAKDLINKLFTRFAKAGKWLDWSKNHAAEHYYTYSPFGFRRNLFGIMAGIQGITSAMLRRAANSPVQGLASQIGVTVARLIAIEVLETALKFGLMTRKDKDLIAQILKAVHDANYTEVPYRFLIPFIHIMQYTATYGVTKYYEDEFGVKFTIEPEIEMEIGLTEDKHYKWDWQNVSLKEIIDLALKDQVEDGDLDAKDVQAARDEIEAPLLNKKFKAYLDNTYPILGQPEYGLELWTPILGTNKEKRKAK